MTLSISRRSIFACLPLYIFIFGSPHAARARSKCVSTIARSVGTSDSIWETRLSQGPTLVDVAIDQTPSV